MIDLRGGKRTNNVYQEVKNNLLILFSIFFLWKWLAYCIFPFLFIVYSTCVNLCDNLDNNFK